MTQLDTHIVILLIIITRKIAKADWYEVRVVGVVEENGMAGMFAKMTLLFNLLMYRRHQFQYQ